MNALFDPGLQPERTELAWRRTTLTMAVGSVVSLRLLTATLGLGWALLGIAGLAGSAALWAAARSRHRRVDAALQAHGDRAPLPGGGLPLALALFVAGTGIVGAVIIFTIAGRSR